jgi:hypothetical protein
MDCAPAALPPLEVGIVVPADGAPEALLSGPDTEAQAMKNIPRTEGRTEVIRGL